jgi:hypothetical protein
MVPSTTSILLGICEKFALLVTGDTGSVLAMLHVDTIPRSIRNGDGITEVWLVLSMLTGLGGTWVKTNPAPAKENTSIAAIPNRNIRCGGD